MREITFNLDDNEFNKFLNFVKRSLKSVENLKSKHIEIEIPNWQKKELDKRINDYAKNPSQALDFNQAMDDIEKEL